MLLIYGDEKQFSQLSDAAIGAIMQAYEDCSQALAAAGMLRGGAELAPTSSASTVRVRNSKVLTTDGPFMETKEQLGGYFLSEVPNLDEAIAWAAKIPSALDGCIEVRPQTANQTNPTGC